MTQGDYERWTDEELDRELLARGEGLRRWTHDGFAKLHAKKVATLRSLDARAREQERLRHEAARTRPRRRTAW